MLRQRRTETLFKLITKNLIKINKLLRFLAFQFRMSRYKKSKNKWRRSRLNSSSYHLAQIQMVMLAFHRNREILQRETKSKRMLRSWKRRNKK